LLLIFCISLTLESELPGEDPSEEDIIDEGLSGETIREGIGSSCPKRSRGRRCVGQVIFRFGRDREPSFKFKDNRRPLIQQN